MTNDKTPTLRPIVTAAIVCLSLCGVAVGAELSSEGTADSLSRATHHALTATVTPGVFCSFLPPRAGGNIADSESDAAVFCNKPNRHAPNGAPLLTTIAARGRRGRAA